MDYFKEFEKDKNENINSLSNDQNFKKLSNSWMKDCLKHKYVYNFSWLGVPIIQFPQDIVAIQELIWKVKPDLIIETGVAHGGSLILSASIMFLLDMDPSLSKLNKISRHNSKVIGIDIDIRSHNKDVIENHPLNNKIELIEGSSIDPHVIGKVKSIAQKFKNIMVFLDSNHTHNHVLEELKNYGPLVSKNSYCVVFDTLIEEMPDEIFSNRSWKKGNSPKSAVKEYLKDDKSFEVDTTIHNKLMITVSPDGFLKRI